MSEMSDLLAEIRGMRQDIRGGGGFASGAMTGQRIVDQTWTGLTNLGRSAAAATTGQYDLKKAMEDVTRIFQIFPGVGEKLGQVFAGTINYVKEINDAMILSGRYGVTFSQNLFKYTQDLANAGISQENFNKLLAGAGSKIQGIGINAQESANMFLETSAALYRDRQVLTLGLMGINFTEFQDQLVITTDLFKYQDIERSRLNKLIADSTIAATIEIDNMARITGRSRQEIQKDIDTQAQSRIVQMAKLSFTPEQAANYNRASAFLATLPQGISDMYVTMQKFKAIPTAEGQQMAGALNAAMPGFVEKMMQMSQTKDEKEQERLMMELRFIYGSAAADRNRQEQLLMQAFRERENPVSKYIIDLFTGKGAQAMGAYRQSYLASGGDFNKFVQHVEDQFRLRDETSRKILTLTQEGKVGAAISQMLLGLDRAIQAGGTAVANYVAGLEGKAGEKLSGIVDPDKALDRILQLKSLSKDQVDDFVASFVGSTAVNLDNPTNRPNLPRYQTRGDTPEDPLHVRVQNFPQQSGPSLRAYAEGTAGPSNRRRVGGWWEDFGVRDEIQVEGIEAIINRNQRIPFALDTLRETGILSAMMAGFKNSVAERNPGSADVIRELSNTIANLPNQIQVPEIKFPTTLDEDKKILAEMVDRLNSKMDKLINAVEDGSRGTVKAVRSQNNLIG